MSKCISRHGEYSEHEFGGDAPEFTCNLCSVFDEDAALAEVAKLRQWKAEASPVILGLQDLGKALGVRLGTRITGEAAAEQARALKAERDHAKEALALAEKDRQTYHRDALAAVKERDELRATVERVRALADGWSKANSWKRSAAKSIRSALDDKAGA